MDRNSREQTHRLWYVPLSSLHSFLHPSVHPSILPRSRVSLLLQNHDLCPIFSSPSLSPISHPRPPLRTPPLSSERQKLLSLANVLHERVVGQEEAVEAVAQAVLRSRAGLSRPEQPTGSFLFLGTRNMKRGNGVARDRGREGGRAVIDQGRWYTQTQTLILFPLFPPSLFLLLLHRPDWSGKERAGQGACAGAV